MYYILQIDDVNNEYDDNAPDTTNKSIACVPAQSTQRNHTSREDSEIPIKKPTECSTVSQNFFVNTSDITEATLFKEATIPAYSYYQVFKTDQDVTYEINRNFMLN